MARTAGTCATGELLASEDVLEGVTAFAEKTVFALARPAHGPAGRSDGRGQ